MSFTEKLKTGLLGEGLISQWLIRRGWQVLPAYEIEQGHGKGPRLFGPYGQLICPDLLVFRSRVIKWVEAKTKSAFTWHRMSSSWQTGIDRKHWQHYLQVSEVTPFPLWLFFLHKPGNQSKDCPHGMISPAGLFGESIQILEQFIDHEHENHGPSGMVYWKQSSLRFLASYEEVADSVALTAG